MTQMLTFMAAPFAACLVLVGIHAYFGIHMIERRVHFVDLAVAQFAALGAVVGFVKGFHPGEPGSTLYSMAFATLAAVLFALTRARDEKLPPGGDHRHYLRGGLGGDDPDRRPRS